MPAHQLGQWIAPKDDDGAIRTVYHLQSIKPLEARIYRKDAFEQRHCLDSRQQVPPGLMKEVRVLRCGGNKRVVIDFNPQDEIEPEQSIWLWGNDWLCNLDWDPREWQWRRLGVLPETSVMNYTTKRGYRVALKQYTEQMPLDAELEREGYNSKARARFFNRIWHPILPRKVSAMQWLVLTQGLPVGAWREKIGLPSDCELCTTPTKETLQHALKDCPQLSRAWDLFRNTRIVASLPPSYLSWTDISRGLMRDPPGPQVEEELRWDTASAFSLNADTPWDVLRAQLLWSIWCQRVAHTFRSEKFHLGVVLWHAWRNTIYCAMEAFKKLFRHKRNEERRQELISCYQQIWTHENIFGRKQGSTIKWNITPHQEFLPRELGAWTVPPIRIRRLSPSPDLEADFVARTDFPSLVDKFLNNVGNTGQHSTNASANDQRDPPTAAPARSEQDEQTDPSEHHTHTASSTEGDTPLADAWTNTHSDLQACTNSQDRHNIPTSFVQQNYTDKSHRAKEDPVIHTHRDTSPRGTLTNNSPGAVSPPLTEYSPTGHKIAHSASREETILPHTTGYGSSRPGSRRKKRCSRRLQHPIHRSRRTQLYKPPSEGNKAEDPGELTRTHSPPPKKPTPAEVKEQAAQEVVRPIPTSRAKRKCRFGPRTRRALSNHHHQGAQRSDPPQPIPKPPDKGQQDSSKLSQVAHTSTSTKEELSLPRTLPDRVTLQPDTRDRWTPFDKYQGTRSKRSNEFNSSKFAAKRLGIPETEFEELLTKEINDLLDEIERTRLDALGGEEQAKERANNAGEELKEPSHPSPIPVTPRSSPPQDVSHSQPKRRFTKNTLHPLESSRRRIKEKCNFGPLSKRGRGKSRTSPPSRRDPPPPPPPCRTPTINDGGEQGRSLLGNDKGCPLFGDATCWRRGDSDRIRPTETHNRDAQASTLPELDDFQTTLPDRPTFFHYPPVWRSPFERYIKGPRTVDPPPPTPLRPVHTRLGISEKEFVERLREEIDCVPTEGVESWQRPEAPENETPPLPSPMPPLTVMTKEDALRFFRHREFPTSGSLLGVYRWAADLGWARFDYESEVDWNDLSFLNAYD